MCIVECQAKSQRDTVNVGTIDQTVQVNEEVRSFADRGDKSCLCGRISAGEQRVERYNGGIPSKRCD
jgi:hypothetical protein